MRIISTGSRASALIFDLDNTLYTNRAYAEFQEKVLIDRLGQKLGIGPEGAAERIRSLRAEREIAGMGKTSLGMLFQALGIDLSTSVRWREECIEPGDWLKRDIQLDAALGILSKKYALGLTTNNPSLVGAKSLDALGVRSRFSVLVGLDDTLRSKPAAEPFKETARRLGIEAARCISIGDRFDVDLAPAIELGMGAVLVDGVEDVYALPEALSVRTLAAPTAGQP
jgi:FMN phosphatase YigB (HAD superfamily)